MFFLGDCVTAFLSGLLIHGNCLGCPMGLFGAFSIDILFDCVVFPVAYICFGRLAVGGEIGKVLLGSLVFDTPSTVTRRFLRGCARLVECGGS